MARVTMNDGIPKRVTRAPLSVPISTPPPITSSVASHGSMPAVLTSRPIATMRNPYTEPTERSISPATSTYVMPTATMPISEALRTTFRRLLAVRNWRVVSEKNAKMINPATVIVRLRLVRAAYAMRRQPVGLRSGASSWPRARSRTSSPSSRSPKVVALELTCSEAFYADDQPHDVVRRGGRFVAHAGNPSATEDQDAVGDREHVAQVVADNDQAGAS